jgi:acyl-coenzyme A synthetase/AMP-(fatty) acid ligase
MQSNYQDMYIAGSQIRNSSGRKLPRQFTGTRSGTKCATIREPHLVAGLAGGSSTPATTLSMSTAKMDAQIKVALIYDSPVTNTIKTFTYRDLLNEVSRFAGVLRSKGVEKGERVIIYMPMVPETLIAMLACARIGAVHSVVFGGFSSPELAKRINDARPRLVVSASCGIEPGRIVPYKPLLDQAIESASWKPQSCIILQRDQERAANDCESRSRLA